MRVRCGRWPGLTPCTATSWRPAPTTGRWSSGRRRTAPGTRCMNTQATTPPVTSRFWFSYQTQWHRNASRCGQSHVCCPAVNSVCWGPYDFGLFLACGSSDGAISVLTCSGDGHWDIKKINNAHTVSFAFYMRLQYPKIYLNNVFVSADGIIQH